MNQAEAKPDPSANPLAGAFGLIAVLGNTVAVFALAKTPHTYKPGTLLKWFEEACQDPQGTILSSWAFALGLIAMIPFVRGLSRLWGDSKLGDMGESLISFGALCNCLGTLFPFVLVAYLVPLFSDPSELKAIAAAMLGLALVLDAFFNLVFGLGLVLVGFALWRSGWRKLGGLGLVSGLLTMPVVLQAGYLSFAYLVLLAGPLWLLWIVCASVVLIRGQSAAPD